MPSLRVMSALAVAALTARPTRSFLAPAHTSTAPRHGGAHAEAARSSASATNSFSSRLPRSSCGPASRGRGSGSTTTSRSAPGRSGSALMMAKKKGGGKKKGAAAAAAAQKKGKAPPLGGEGGGQSSSAATAAGTGAAAAAGEAAGGAAAVAVAPSPFTVAVAGHEEQETPQDIRAAIQNRAADEEPVATTAVSAAAGAAGVTAEAAVNGARNPSAAAGGAGAAAAAGGGGGGSSKGFGAPVPQPRPMQKGLNRGPQPMTKPQKAPSAAQAGGAARSGGAPPMRQAGGTGMDALSPGVPVAGNTDHQRVITEVDFTDPESAASLGTRSNDGEMSPSDMLQYLRDNNLTVDLETMNPVAMPKDSAAKMEAMFPYPAANVMAELYLGPRPKPSQFADAMIALLPKDEPWNGSKIRPLPELKEFLIANRLHSGNRGLNVITTMMLQAMSKGDVERAKFLKGAAICFTKAENTITGPFRQAVMFAENRLAPCMGSTVCEEYAGNDGADAAATWVVLKACVAEWELRLREMRNEEIGLHDIFRTMPNPTEGLDEERTDAITGSVQAMGLAFGNNEKLMKSLPVELRFMEGALGLNTTTEVRRYALQEFCPEEGVSPEELRLRVRSLICGMDQLPAKSYHRLQIAVTDVYDCLVEGTPEDYCLYMNNWDQGENLSFETYRLDTGEIWRNRLRDIITAPTPKREDRDDYERLFKEILPRSLWNFAASDNTDSFELPFVMLKKGWWDVLDFLDEDKVADKNAREAVIEAAQIKDPSLMKDGDPEPVSDDIFSDFMTEERSKLTEFEFSEADFEVGGDEDDIPDGPGPGMEELDIGL